jgi:hypothetical protein
LDIDFVKNTYRLHEADPSGMAIIRLVSSPPDESRL